MVAALRNLQIAVVARGQLDVGLRDQVDIGPLAGRGVRMHCIDDLFVLMRAGHCQHLRMRGADRVGFFAHAAGHDDAAVLRDRLADRLQALFLGGIEEAAGVHEHHVGPGIIGAHRIAVGAQPREDALAVDQCLGTAEGYHADLLLVGDCGGGRAHDCARPYTRAPN